MKPFDLELAKQGHPVITRDGFDAKIICFNKKGEYPLVALVKDEDGDEHSYEFTLNGNFIQDEEGDDDLLMKEIVVKEEKNNSGELEKKLRIIEGKIEGLEEDFLLMVKSIDYNSKTLHEILKQLQEIKIKMENK